MSAATLEKFAAQVRTGLQRAEEVAASTHEPARDLVRATYLASWCRYLAEWMEQDAKLERACENAGAVVEVQRAARYRADTRRLFPEACEGHSCDEKCGECAGATP